MTMNKQIITDMGILSDIVYSNFDTEYIYKGAEIKADKSGEQTLSSAYTVKDYADTPTDMQALLLQNDDKYVIAFRGTESAQDWVTNISTGVFNYNPQFNDALAFVQNMMSEHNISASNLTLAGHSLGGILTQAVGATLKIKGYAYNPWGASSLAKFDPNNIQASVLQYLQRAISGADASQPDLEFAQNNILNISYNDDGVINGDILSNG